MTERQRRSLGRYIRRLADVMGLRDWDLRLLPEAPGSPLAGASCDPVYGRRLANIRVADDWMTFTPQEQRTVIVHELLHVHTAAPLMLVHDVLPGLLGPQAWSVFEAAFRQVNEQAVDAIAAAIADHFPLWEG